MIETYILISRENGEEEQIVSLGKTNGILQVQTEDKKICDVYR